MCMVGRTYAANHPVCRSCQAQGVKCNSVHQQSKKSSSSAAYRTYTIDNRLICTKDLASPNTWTGHANGPAIYKRERRDWRNLIENTRKRMSPAVFLWGTAKGK